MCVHQHAAAFSERLTALSANEAAFRKTPWDPVNLIAVSEECACATAHTKIFPLASKSARITAYIKNNSYNVSSARSRFPSDSYFDYSAYSHDLNAT